VSNPPENNPKDSPPDTERPRDARSSERERPFDETASDRGVLEMPTEPHLRVHAHALSDVEATVNLTGDILFPPPREDLPPSPDEDDTYDGSNDTFPSTRPTERATHSIRTIRNADAGEPDIGPGSRHAQNETDIKRVADFGDATDATIATIATELSDNSRSHLKGLLEALVFVTEKPARAADLAKSAGAPSKDVRDMLGVLRDEYAARGIQLDEVAGGWIFRTSPLYAAFVRGVSQMRPVKLTRAQIETLAILAYRQPITRPEIDEIRGVDSGPVLKLLLDRDLIRILGKKDEPGRPLLYGTTQVFLEFFGLKALRDMPTLREFTELNEDSRRVVERELGDVLDERQDATIPDGNPSSSAPDPRDLEDEDASHDTVAVPEPPEPKAERANLDELFGDVDTSAARQKFRRGDGEQLDEGKLTDDES
jgi:segregation and condensation protein B